MGGWQAYSGGYVRNSLCWVTYRWPVRVGVDGLAFWQRFDRGRMLVWISVKNDDG